MCISEGYKRTKYHMFVIWFVWKSLVQDSMGGIFDM